MQATQLQSCPRNVARASDNTGLVLFPANQITGSVCDDNDNDPSNDRVSINPALSGCTFSHNSGNPFQTCANSAQISGEYSAQCGAPPPLHFSLSGALFNQLGQPLAGKMILNNGAHAATTDQNGNFALIVDEHADNVISPADRADPASVDLNDISTNHASINFVILPPTPTPAPTQAAPQQPTATPILVGQEVIISGNVTDENGLPMVGVSIYNGEDEFSHKEIVAVSDSAGHYSFNVDSHSDNWVTARADDEDDDGEFPMYFLPGGYAINDVEEDQSNTNFARTNENLVLMGHVSDSNGNLLGGVSVNI
jgi:hypothetical protein